MKYFSLSVFLLVGFFSPCCYADKTAEALEKMPPHQRFEVLINGYEEALSQAARRKLPLQKVKQLKQIRDKQLQLLIDSQKSTPLTDLSIVDLVAISTSHEYLHQWEGALRYAQAAFDRSPRDESVYPCLIRSLLNLKRVDEAEDALAVGREELGKDSPVNSLHFFLAMCRKDQGDIEKSVQHYGTLYTYYLNQLDDDSFDLFVPANHLAGYWNILVSSQGKAKAVELFTGYLDQVTRAHTLNDPEVVYSERQLHRSTFFFALRHEMTRLAVPDSLEQIQRDWLHFAVKQLVRDPNSRVAWGAFGKMMDELSNKSVLNRSDIEKALRSLDSSAFFQDNSAVSQRIEKDLHGLVSPDPMPEKED
ncbi:tetratricopeptide repeat protein [Bremerella cremea]|uniref:Tetratricopeptide repeat protein n=1 Tax=Bremerella cremea TaxID=1031537 RepID=A0A368KQK1_9BACT|nr:tetratricopeptide repeat protein [Bremerella cremea]RCS44026.1 tetratricopeptide repeat protein [Bremerella cremea]